MDWVFDMDGTLYSGVDRMWDELVHELRTYFVQTKNLPVDWTVEEQDRLKKKWRTRQTLVAYLNEFNLSFDDIVEATHLPVLDRLHFTLRPGVECIRSLPGRKWILTNSPEAFAYALLRKLSLLQVFDGVYGIRHDFRVAKPDQESFMRIPVNGQTIVIDDWHENLMVPSALGWTTVWFPEPNIPRPHAPLPYVEHEIHSLTELMAFVF